MTLLVVLASMILRTAFVVGPRVGSYGTVRKREFASLLMRGNDVLGYMLLLEGRNGLQDIIWKGVLDAILMMEKGVLTQWHCGVR